MTPEADVDLLIIGGGVNGAGMARDAAGRGFSVLLCEQGDLACATSSASSKLIHGGLRYLEHYDFRLVREALREREILLRIAPHVVWPMTFVLPYDKGVRPQWMIRLGLYLYDRLAPRKHLPASSRFDLHGRPEGAPLKRRFGTGFSYSDCQVDDARLVALNAVDAAERGADVRTRTRCHSARREQAGWRVALKDQGSETIIRARALVNAAGPWADEVANLCRGPAPRRLRLVKGSHIITPRLYAGDHAYILQNDDGRVVFVTPFAQRFSLIGTTEIAFEGDPAKVAIDADEVDYLCRAASRYFDKPLDPKDVAHHFSGVRALYEDNAPSPSAATRDYFLDLDAPAGTAPLLSAYGGKITTYRRLAERAVDMLSERLAPPRPKPWTASAPLPGGDFPDGDFDRFVAQLTAQRPWLLEPLALRLARSYGTRVETILGSAQRLGDLGEDFGAGLHEVEIDYLAEREWARTEEDLLWRRSKLGLHMTPDERRRVGAYICERAKK
ncbi:glycerol-3-phosphate dehydrogenase [Methylocella silvestris]|uniref:Glycerol-3-phosphate dehydrogenase n=1 Tax=Methylocella silvestris TaxID=199596 RepID=A0A2J7TCY7_METSI|nr:glycerol-3-phosphate dehydrogenase [Methylocella silvestris]PNG24631.1 glycerol-3-phosphate dehydrogenase [Methylocella silvestris]